MPFPLTINMEQVSCWECGICFCVPERYLYVHRRDEESFYCPNGHEVSFAPPEEAEPPMVRELRQQLTQAIHDAEQAEARASDRLRAATEVSDAAAEGKPLMVVDGHRTRCGLCDQSYLSVACLRKHLRLKHGLTNEQIDARCREVSPP